MSRRPIFLLFLFLFASIFTAVGQGSDSTTFVNYVWNSTKIKKGIRWKQGTFDDLFSSRQEINIVEVDLNKASKWLKLVGLSDSLAYTSDLAKQEKATVAINGGFFDMKNGGAVDYIKIDDTVLSTTKNTNSRANALFAFSRKKIVITDRTDSAIVNSNYPNVMLSGPLLLQNAARIELVQNAFNENRHPRTAVAITKDKLILIVVDGRNAQAQGMSLSELSNVLKWLGTLDGMNLDGGGSTTLYIDGRTPNGIVNYPSDNKLFDHYGERKVANTILIL